MFMPWKMILPAEPKTGEPVEDEITDESVELPEEEPEQGDSRGRSEFENRQ